MGNVSFFLWLRSVWARLTGSGTYITPALPPADAPVVDYNALLIAEAVKYVGTMEQGGHDRGPEIDAFVESFAGLPLGSPWCMAFVHYCILQIVAKNDVQSLLYRSPSCLTVWNNTPVSERLAVPVPGAIVIWEDGSTPLGHTGIVTAVDGTGPFTLHTVEGNTTPPAAGDDTTVQRAGNGVYLKIRSSLGTPDFKIKGFLKPFVC